MRRIILTALITCLAVGTAAAQSCDSKAVSANGKPLHGAAKMSFVKKCKRDACGSKAVSAEGKPLHGAAKNSFMAKCMRSCLERWPLRTARLRSLRLAQRIIIGFVQALDFAAVEALIPNLQPRAEGFGRA